METSFEYDLPDGKIRVVDGVLTPSQVSNLSQHFGRAAFKRDETDGPMREKFRTLNADASADDHPETAELVHELVRLTFPDRELELMRVHCNLIVYGDMAFPHRDCAPDRGDATVLVFANEEWDREWGGELTFFDGHDVVASVTPKPGRMACFDGSLEHRVGIPMRECYEPRLTMAWKFKTPGDWR